MILFRFFRILYRDIKKHMNLKETRQLQDKIRYLEYELDYLSEDADQQEREIAKDTYLITTKTKTIH